MPTTLPFPTDLTGIAAWLGGSMAGAVIVSLLLERIPAFKAWKSPYKTYAVLVLFVALPFAADLYAWALAHLSPETVAMVQAALSKALFGLLAWAASQFAHQGDPAA